MTAIPDWTPEDEAMAADAHSELHLWPNDGNCPNELYGDIVRWHKARVAKAVREARADAFEEAAGIVALGLENGEHDYDGICGPLDRLAAEARAGKAA